MSRIETFEVVHLQSLDESVQRESLVLAHTDEGVNTIEYPQLVVRRTEQLPRYNV